MSSKKSDLFKTLRQFRFLIIGLACLAGLFVFVTKLQPSTASKKLLVYAYSSFTASWGPGPALKKLFEEKCQCEIELRDADDSRMLLNRIQMEAQRVRADVAIGFNQWDVDEVVENLDFEDREVNYDGELPENLRTLLAKEKKLVAFDWGILAFNTKVNSSVAKAKNFDEFIAKLPSKSLALQDPRTSAPGLSFLFWLIQTKGEDGAFSFLKQLNPKIYTIASGWSSSYGLFQKNQAKAVFSYVTSPLYHRIEEKDLNYLALPFEEGMPIHIEYAGVLSSCSQCGKAREFVRFLLTPEAQKILMQKNYMLPIDSRVAQGTPWELAKEFKTLPSSAISAADRKRILERWTQWMRER